MTRRYLTAGHRAVLVELDGLDRALGLYGRLSEAAARGELEGVTELLPAARTVLVSFDPHAIDVASLTLALDRISDAPASEATGSTVEIDVVYDGEDLDEVAGLVDLSREALVTAHTGAHYLAAFAGFAPGFVYLTNGPTALQVPRRPSPRTRIPAGSVALAGEFSGIYPRSSPGGWQLIGRTDAIMWDAEREQPALVRPGDTVRFVAVRELVHAAPSQVSAAKAESSAALVFEQVGLPPLLQDAGRFGLTSLGVSPSGVLDRASARLANELVGNEPGEAVVEIAYGNLTVRCDGDAVVAIAGAHAPVTVRRSGGGTATVTDQRAIALDDGDRVVIGAPSVGVRSYLAVRGGFDALPVLGSLATDTLAGLGPAPIARDDRLGIRAVTGARTATAEAMPPAQLATDVVEVRVLAGPRDDWFAAESLQLLTQQSWSITDHADRVGLRLHGESPLVRRLHGELPSEGAATGSIQVPPNGQPVVFLADHPITGGYPIIGVIHPADLDALAQAAPGMRVAFRLEGAA